MNNSSPKSHGDDFLCYPIDGKDGEFFLKQETKEKDRKSKKPKKEKSPKPKYNMAQNSWFMVKLAWTTQEKKVVVLGLLTALTAVALNLVSLYVSPSILAVVERQGSVSELVGTIAVFAFALMLLSAAAKYIEANILYGRITVRSELITALNRKATMTSYPNLYDDRFLNLLTKSGDVINSNNASGEAIWTTLTDLTQNLLGFAAYVVLLAAVEPMMILVIALTAACAYFIGKQANRWYYKHREEEAEQEKRMDYLLNSCGRKTAKDIRIFGLRAWMQELYDKAYSAFLGFQRKSQNRYLLAAVGDLILTFLRNAVAYAYLIGLVLKNGLSIAEFLLYFSAVEGFAAWVTGILSNLQTLHRQSLDLSTLRECLDYPEPFRFEDGEALTPEKDGEYELRLENVSYRYPGADEDTLKNINLTLRPGEKLAVVGLNGAGKTTLVKILCGFLDPTEGRVLLNGTDIRNYNRRDYYTMFSAVFQNFSLLAGSVAANVAQDDVVIDRERVKACVAKAGLTEKVESLPEGYETKLNRTVYDEAVELSGGETQRLMLARALYKDAPFVILDEPTAALDPIAESELYQKYHEMTDGKSSVYISHRLASTRFCDRIIMIADGGIGEEGTHEELLHAGGKYAELFEVQSRYYKEGGEDDEG